MWKQRLSTVYQKYSVKAQLFVLPKIGAFLIPNQLILTLTNTIVKKISKNTKTMN